VGTQRAASLSGGSLPKSKREAAKADKHRAKAMKRLARREAKAAATATSAR
jgi:hypothetical protein